MACGCLGIPMTIEITNCLHLDQPGQRTEASTFYPGDHLSSQTAQVPFVHFHSSIIIHQLITLPNHRCAVLSEERYNCTAISSNGHNSQ